MVDLVATIRRMREEHWEHIGIWSGNWRREATGSWGDDIGVAHESKSRTTPSQTLLLLLLLLGK